MDTALTHMSTIIQYFKQKPKELPYQTIFLLDQLQQAASSNSKET